MRRALPPKLQIENKKATGKFSHDILQSKAKILNDVLEVIFQDWKLAILKGGLGGGGEGDGRGRDGRRDRRRGLRQRRRRQRRRRLRLRRIRRDRRRRQRRRRQLWGRSHLRRGGGRGRGRGRGSRGRRVQQGLGAEMNGC